MELSVEAMEQTASQQSILDALLQSSPAAIGIKDLHGRYLLVNQKFSSLFSLSQDQFIGKTSHEVFNLDIARNYHQDNIEVLQTGKPLVVEYNIMVDGLERFFMVNKFPIFDSDNKGKVFATGIIAVDITESKNSEFAMTRLNERLQSKIHEVSELKEKLYKQTIHDSLTKLFNRRYLDEALEREIRKAEKEQSPLSIVIIDLDNFKLINDQHGHPFGDQVLINFANLVQKQMKVRQLAGRLGGEEFMLILPRATAFEAYSLTEKLRCQYKALNHNHSLNQNPQAPAVHNTFSAGVAQFPEDATTLNSLIKAADDALYSIKNTSRDCVITFNNCNHSSPVFSKNIQKS